MGTKEKLYEMATNFGLSEEKSRLYADVFQTIDTNHDGTISAEELQKALLQLGYTSSSEQTEKMVALVDENNDGMVDFSEFIHMAERNSICMQEDLEEDILLAFKMFDINNDGMINIQELQQAMAKLGQPLTKKEALEMLKAMDENGDGLISYREFVHSWTDLMSNDDSDSF